MCGKVHTVMEMHSPRRRPLQQEAEDKLLTPGEVARLFGVNPKTITRWANSGKLSPVRSLGGHRRYRASQVFELLQKSGLGRRDVDS